MNKYIDSEWSVTLIAHIGNALNNILTLATATSITIRLFTNFMTLIPSLVFIELRVVSMDHLQRLLYDSSEHFPFRTPGSVWALLTLQLLRPVFPNLICLFLTCHLEYPSVLSGFCLIHSQSWFIAFLHKHACHLKQNLQIVV